MNENNPQAVSNNEEIQLGDVWKSLLKQKGVLLSFAVLFGLLGVAYTVLVPARYEVKSTILLPASKSVVSSAASLAMSLGVGSPGGGDTTLPMFKKILESETVVNIVSKSCGIPTKQLKQMRTIEDDAKTNSIEIAVQNKDKEVALKINRSFINALRQVNAKLSLPSKGKKSELLEASLKEQEKELAEAEKRMEQFTRTSLTAPGSAMQSGNGGKDSVPAFSPAFRYRDQLNSLSLELERLSGKLSVIRSKSVSASEIKPIDFPPVQVWRSQLSELETKLGTLRAQYSEDSHEVTVVRDQYMRINTLMQTEIKKYLKAVEEGVTGPSAQVDQERTSMIQQIAAIRKLVDAAPAEATEYQRLVREVSILTTLVSQLRVQYEQSKLDRGDDPNRWEILDEPTPSEEPVNKKYVRNVLLAALLGLFIGIPVALRRNNKRS